MSRPRVSILIPSHDYERYLARALDSVACQTYDDIEVVVVDDCSSDGSAELLRDVLPRLGRRWVLEVNEVNRGFGWTLQRALSLATGDVIGLLDPDDFLLPEKVARQHGAFADPGVVVAYSEAVASTDWADERPWETDDEILAKAGPITPGGPIEGSVTSHLLRHGTAFGPTSALVRRAALDAIGGYRADLRTTVDYRTWLHLSTLGPFTYVPGLVGGTTIHARSMRATQGAQKRLDRMAILEEFAGRHGMSGDVRYRARRNLRAMQVRGERARRREALRYVRWSKDPVGLVFAA